MTKKRKPAKRSVPRGGTRKRVTAAREEVTPAFEVAKPTSADQLALTPPEHLFCLAYLENGFNATRAYQVAHPAASSTTARADGYRYLTKAHIRRLLNSRLEDVWKPLQMGGEQALGRLARIASADIRDLYDEKGELLPVNHWPDSIASCVKSVKDGPYGKTVTLVDQVVALRTVLDQTGKLKTLPQSVDALAAALRADLEAHKDV